MSTATVTLPRQFWRLASERGDTTMLRQKELGVWRTSSWRQLAETIGQVAAGLSTLGVKPGQVVGIVSNTCRDWLVADLGAQTAGAVVAGLHVSDSARVLCEELRALDARVLFVEDEEQLETLLEAGDLGKVEHIVAFRTDGLRRAADPRVISLRQLGTRGAEALAADAGLVDRGLASRRSNDVAAIVYTSGATGTPKGAMLSHSEVLAASAALCDALSTLGNSGGERLLFLPLSHVMERVGLYSGIAQGAVLNFVESPDTVFDNLREVQPDVFLAVPRIWQRLHSMLAVALREATSLQQWAYARALSLGERVASAREQGNTPSVLLRLAHGAADWLVLGNLRRMMGLDRLRLGVAGGAPLSPSLVRWYRAMGVDLRQAWGLTEMCGYAAIAAAGDPPEAAGKPLPGVEIRISDVGEVLVRGESLFHAYAGDAGPATASEQRWFRTGDVGRIDASGRLSVVGRLDEIIVTAAGQQVLPAELENRIKSSPYIADVVVVGDARPHLSCLVMIDHDAVEQWAQSRQVPFSDFRSLCASPEVVQLVAQEIERASGQDGQGIDAFRLIDTPAEADEESLTPAMKLKRWRVVQRYGDAIESMYAAAAA